MNDIIRIITKFPLIFDTIFFIMSTLQMSQVTKLNFI